MGEGIGGFSSGELIFFRKSDKGGQEARGDGLDLGGQFDKIKDGLKIKDVWVKWKRNLGYSTLGLKELGWKGLFLVTIREYTEEKTKQYLWFGLV